MFHPIIKYVPNSITSKVGRAALQTSKNSPTLLFGAGMVGFVATVALASRATLKMDTVVDETKENLQTAKELSEKNRPDYSADDYKKDVFYIYSRATVDTFKLYAPAIVIGGLSIACLTGSHHILSKRNAGLMAAYTALDSAFTEYRRRVSETLGADTDREFRYGSEIRTTTKASDGSVVDVKRVGPYGSSGYARFFDEFSQEFSRNHETNLFFLKCQQNTLNDRLHSRGHLFLNEAYESLGMPATNFGAVVGWLSNGDGDNYVDFGIFENHELRARDFVNGRENSILVDFNVDGMIYGML